MLQEEIDIAKFFRDCGMIKKNEIEERALFKIYENLEYWYCSAGEILFEKKEPSNQVFFLISGKIDILKPMHEEEENERRDSVSKSYSKRNTAESLVLMNKSGSQEVNQGESSILNQKSTNLASKDLISSCSRTNSQIPNYGRPSSHLSDQMKKKHSKRRKSILTKSKTKIKPRARSHTKVLKTNCNVRFSNFNIRPMNNSEGLSNMNLNMSIHNEVNTILLNEKKEKMKHRPYMRIFQKLPSQQQQNLSRSNTNFQLNPVKKENKIDISQRLSLVTGHNPKIETKFQKKIVSKKSKSKRLHLSKKQSDFRVKSIKQTDLARNSFRSDSGGKYNKTTSFEQYETADSKKEREEEGRRFRRSYMSNLTNQKSLNSHHRMSSFGRVSVNSAYKFFLKTKENRLKSAQRRSSSLNKTDNALNQNDLEVGPKTLIRLNSRSMNQRTSQTKLENESGKASSFESTSASNISYLAIAKNPIQRYKSIGKRNHLSKIREQEYEQSITKDQFSDLSSSQFEEENLQKLKIMKLFSKSITMNNDETEPKKMDCQDKDSIYSEHYVNSNNLIPIPERNENEKRLTVIMSQPREEFDFHKFQKDIQTRTFKKTKLDGLRESKVAKLVPMKTREYLAERKKIIKMASEQLVKPKKIHIKRRKSVLKNTTSIRFSVTANKISSVNKNILNLSLKPGLLSVTTENPSVLGNSISQATSGNLEEDKQKSTFNSSKSIMLERTTSRMTERNIRNIMKIYNKKLLLPENDKNADLRKQNVDCESNQNSLNEFQYMRNQTKVMREKEEPKNQKDSKMVIYEHKK